MKLFGVTDRTLRLYLRYRIRRLMAVPVKLEHTLRAEERRSWFAARLPMSVPVCLFGRESELERLGWITDHVKPRHIQITGD